MSNVPTTNTSTSSSQNQPQEGSNSTNQRTSISLPSSKPASPAIVQEPKLNYAQVLPSSLSFVRFILTFVSVGCWKGIDFWNFHSRHNSLGYYSYNICSPSESDNSSYAATKCILSKPFLSKWNSKTSYAANWSCCSEWTKKS